MTLARNETSISLSERVATAFVSIVAAALTLLVLPWIFATKGSSGEPFTLYGWIFSKYGLAIIASAAAAGFIFGSEKMANAFSFFWGTHPVWEEGWFQKGLVALVVIVIVSVLLNLV